MKKIGIVLALVFFICESAGGSSGTTLEEAVARALELDPGVKIQVLNEEASRASREDALRQKYFRLDAGGSYLFTTNTVQVKAEDFFLPSDLPESVDFPLFFNPKNTLLLSAPHHFYDLKVGMLQPLYAGGVLSRAVEAEDIRGLIERKKTRFLEIALAGQVKASFLNFRLLTAKRESLSLLLENLGLHLRKLEAFFREDLVRKSDILETETKMEEARAGLEEIGVLLDKERIVFESLCGIDPAEVEPGHDERVEALEEALSFFKTRHPMSEVFDERERLLGVSRKIIRGANRPQLSGYGELHYGKPGVNFFKKEWTMYLRAGLTLSIPIFNWNHAARDEAFCEIEERKVKEERAAFLEETERSLRHLYSLRESLEARKIHAENLVRLAGEDARLKERLYEENQVSHFEYLSSVLTLEKYRSLVKELEVQVEMAEVGINTLIGRQGGGE